MRRHRSSGHEFESQRIFVAKFVWFEKADNKRKRLDMAHLKIWFSNTGSVRMSTLVAHSIDVVLSRVGR